MEKQRTIIIIGGGFGGLQLARRLRKTDFRILLFDKQNHHQFQPLFYQVASSRLEPSTISFPFRKIFQKFPNLDFILAEVISVNPGENEITTSIGNFKYDFLVIASGCKTNYFGNKELENNCLPMKTTGDAIEIRNRILLGFEKYISTREDDKDSFLNIVIVGAGPTGVELAGAFAEMKNNILPKDYPHNNFSKLRIILLEGSSNTLNNMSDASKKASMKYLIELGVSVITGVFVKSYDGEKVSLSNGETIRSRNVIWAAGVTGSIIDGIDKESTTKSGRYIVDRYNQVLGYSNIFSIGDIAYMETPLYPHGHPQVANVAINQGKNLAFNLKNKISGKPLREYEYKDLGSMATIGKHRAVVDLPFMRFKGYFAWFIWMFLHLMLILSVKNKLLIFINWAWYYLTKDSSLRLIIDAGGNKNKL
ncbi:MAG TPA: NAD(P)/FAD-dependent oxidoreductase [Bacteroidales bacterium]|nr:NAD(P)/FAD-dependent oxidoreductase [Bacteroidales bacterium]HPT20708.1 NAD(P)/FAD-dependent oxidoreductase [Bacteroidales bacterium]